MGSKKKVTVGYRYYMGLHFGLCHGPVDQVQKIEVGEREAWSGSVTANSTIAISKPDLFGGDKKEGGIVGALDILMGGASQAVNSYLLSKLGAPIPAFRGILSAVYKQGQVSANNPYVKPWAFKVKRILQGWSSGSAWNSGKADISGDMNPAHIIYQALTDIDWGMGYPPASLNAAAFTDAADTLFDEGFGMSMIWNQQSSLEDFIRIVLDHIGGVLYVEADTGKFSLKLIRGDYVKASLKLYGPSNLISAEGYQRQGWGETVNEITVIYRDRETNKDAAITVQDLANITTQGAVIGQTKQYPGISNAGLAKLIAQRDLNSQSTPLSRIKLKANRGAWAEIPGAVIRLTWPDYGIDDVVFRVLEVNGGTLQDGTITIECAEDIFAFPTNSYAGTQPGGWTNPTSPPAVAPYRMMIETPYWDLATTLTAADLDYIDPSSGYLETVATRPSGDAFDYEIWVAAPSTYELRATGDFCPTATLAAGISPAYSGTISLANGVDLDLVSAGGYAIIGGTEYVLVDSINLIAGTISVQRGVLDTLPQTHSAGARIWFADGYQGVDEAEYANGEVIYVKLLPSTGQGTLAIGAATADAISFARRHNRPYPPGQFKINNSIYPAQVTVPKITATWRHRDRILQTASIVSQASESIGPEAGVTYSIRFYNASNTLLHSATGLAGTSYSWISTPEVLLLHMDGANNSNTFTDAVGNSVSPAGTAKISTTESRFGGASGFFDGTVSYLTTIPEAGSLTADFGIEFWMFVDAYTGAGTVDMLMHFYENPGSPIGFNLTIDDAGKIGLYLYSAATSDLSTDAVPLSQWTHIAFTRSGNTLRVFIDGVLQFTRSATPVMPSQNTLYIGQSTQPGSGPYTGYLDELRIVKGSAPYTAAFTPPSSAFVLSPPASVRIELESVRSALTSMQKHNHSFAISV